MTLVRIPSRVISLISGDFVASGVWLAKQELETERMKWAVSKWADDSQLTLKQNEFIKKSSKVFQEFVKNLLKIVNYPIAIIGMEITALVGIFFPKIGRDGLGWIEDQWSRSLVPIAPLTSSLETPPVGYTDYAYLCMQKKTVWDKRNLYRIFREYNQQTIRSRLLRNKDLIERYGVILSKLGVDLAALQHKIDEFKGKLLNYSRHDTAELTYKEYTPTEKQLKISDKLYSLTGSIQWLRETLLEVSHGDQRDMSRIPEIVKRINDFSFEI